MASVVSNCAALSEGALVVSHAGKNLTRYHLNRACRRPAAASRRRIPAYSRRSWRMRYHTRMPARHRCRSAQTPPQLGPAPVVGTPGLKEPMSSAPSVSSNHSTPCLLSRFPPPSWSWTTPARFAPGRARRGRTGRRRPRGPQPPPGGGRGGPVPGPEPRTERAGGIRPLGAVRSRRSARRRQAAASSAQGRRRRKGRVRYWGAVSPLGRGARQRRQDPGGGLRRAHRPAPGACSRDRQNFPIASIASSTPGSNAARDCPSFRMARRGAAAP